jgi:hypothetical protein
MFDRYGKKQTRGSRIRDVAYHRMYWFRCCAFGVRMIIFICHKLQGQNCVLSIFNVLQNLFPWNKGKECLSPRGERVVPNGSSS